MKTEYKIQRLSRCDKGKFVELMSKAFEEDPLFHYLFKEDEYDQPNKQRVVSFLSFLFDKSDYLLEEVWGIYNQNQLMGAYVMEVPTVNKVKKAYGSFKLLGRGIQLMSRLSIKTIIKLNRYMKISRNHAPKQRLHYLIMIGVSPSAQGSGVGKLLLQHMIKHAQEDSHYTGMVLDTENRININFYRKFGFDLYNQSKLGDVYIYTMVREK
ncbi:Acetyltransferase (GNAT) family protein [Gracilibacillus orientalis]|uniref:Acetyltransferase (GNAT) family protein n=1 Tax=Gracilibacillus orientalis TaxID=334253 RepID=A0A1I4K413_9BACI|nr:GNAT family N-acetyltransferase [Gracilibacillus orientalis]SFL73485.1 Acetyltransferase (GNAT) family protein [Gracilibacillus orientalis]